MMVYKVSRAALTLVVAVAAVAAGGSRAQAQSLRPNIMFIFDTSGSMGDDAGGTWRGENTNICWSAMHDSTTAPRSKLFSLKSAIRAALAQVGTDEANFGLMSFPSEVITPIAYPATCPAEGSTCGDMSGCSTNNPCTGWCRQNQNALGNTGHYRTTAPRAGVATPNRSNGDYAYGCIMSTHGIETTVGTWFNNGISQVLRVGVTSAAPGVTPTAANYDPADANIPAIYRWIDNVELPVGTGAVTDPELHANGATPLGRSIFYSKLYFDNFVKPVDPKAVCRKNVVVFVTDGAETCDNSTAPSAAFDTTTCTGGTAFNPFHPVVQACQLFRQSGVKMYLVTDSGLSATDLANADRIAAAGGSTSAIRVSLADPNAAKAALVGIIAETVPPAETCNGLDDNCNGQIDEGVKNMCPLDTTGALKHCAVETANCLDDDCDGLIDEGFPPNACGQGAGCPVPPEVCDGLDNDCDGDIDEGFNVGQSCNNGLTGTCRRIGITECTADKMSVMCRLTDAPTQMEVCNGLDDDCNGMIDDNLGPGQGIGIDCGVQGQGCTKGITRCIGGKVVCEGSSMPTAETCNGRDDDCNGLIDDGTFPTVGDSCLCPGLTQAQVGVGVCRAGRLMCKGVEGIKCDGCVLPQPEICNGKDDDCDGMSDYMAMCPSGFGCREGSCGLLCRAGEFPCPPGYDCVDNYCVPNRCKNVTCASDQKCDNATGSCVDLCYKVTCLTGQTCVRGACLDCNNSPLFACKADETCVNRQCMKDKCSGVKCNGDEYCSAGKCVTLQCEPKCSPTEICIQGQCKPFNCGTAVCNPNQYCDFTSGTCKTNMCYGKSCAYCAKSTGECTPDPCMSVRCPNDGCWSCEATPEGQPYCKLGNDCAYSKVLAGNTGGGCSCDVGGGAPGPMGLAVTLLAGLGLTIANRRRRRR